MEMSTAAAPQESDTPQETAPEDQSAERIFQYSEWIHVGPGAEACEHRQDGKCADAGHFHAWIRLPNKFQVTAIREKAQAARARVLRQAKDPESDRSAIIDNQLAEARSQGAAVMIEELTARNQVKWTRQAMSELAEDSDDGEETSAFATIEEDQVRWQELLAMGDEAREEAGVDGEYRELTSHLERWNDEVEKRFAELMRPERESLEGRTEDELGELLRDQVVNEQANQVFMRIFSKWQWVLCTMRPNAKGHMDKVFSNVAALEGEAPEVIAALESSFNALEQRLNERSALRAEGN